MTYPYKKRLVGGNFMGNIFKLGGFEMVIGIIVVVFLISIVLDDGFE
ncbi:hypothetical protein BLGI_2617 [Brevibacillus laterosporus GI-9]|nr:hypothetical protein BLGI_2617 [Brevibacillus laterosporus GI-9]